MGEFIRVNKIEFNYLESDAYGQKVHIELVVDNNNYSDDWYNLWDDPIPIYAMLYNKVLNNERYTLVTEINANGYEEYRIRKGNKGKVLLMLYFDIPPLKVQCEFTKQELLEMLKKPMLAAAKDQEYIDLVFDKEHYDIVNNKDDKEEYEEYIAMLTGQLLL